MAAPSPSRIRFSELNQTFRKSGPGPIMPSAQPPPPTQAQLQQQQQLELQRRELARSRSKIPTDKELPDGVGDVIIGDAAERYRSLRQAEKNLDAIMMRKRLENHDAMQRSHQIHKTMRIWISNTAENQPWQQTTMDNEAFDFGDSSQATYRVKIEGRLLEDDDDDDIAEDGEENADPTSTEEGPGNKEQKKPAVPQRTRLSHFFKQIIIEYDRNPSLQPDQMTRIEWKKPDSRDARNNKVLNLSEEANFDCLEFERKGDENANITISLVRDDFPERFRLSPPLADLLDRVEGDRAEVLTRIWNYIQANKLNEDDDMRVARADPKLRPVLIHPFSQSHSQAQLPQILQQDRFYFASLPEMLTRHLTPLPPIKLPYTIRVDESYQSSPTPTTYDIKVLIEDPLRSHVSSTLAATTPLTQIEALDHQTALTINALQASKAKHDFFEAMAKDPVNFTKRWISSQRRDMEVILGESSRGVGGGPEEGLGEEWRRGGADGVWGSEQARESVSLHLARTLKMQP